MKKIIAALMLPLMLCSCSLYGADNMLAKQNNNAEKIIKLAPTQAIDDQMQSVVNTFAKKVMQLTEGKMQVTIAPNDNIHINQTGHYDIAFADNRQLAKISDDFKLFNIPFMFKSEQHLSLILNSQRIKNYVNYELESKYKIKVFGCISKSSNPVVSSFKPYYYEQVVFPVFAVDKNADDEIPKLMNEIGFNAEKMDVYNINRKWAINEVSLFEVNEDNYDKFAIDDGDYYIID
ncbi:MAG TPA: hypothetical protein DCP97_01610, partial [Ruminococcaceae bacterium]|nr:hypothetical protein [Oscillospiraceae bacterium]